VEGESGDGEGQRRREERKRDLAWIGSLLRAMPFGRGKREKSGGFARLWKRKKIRGKRKKGKRKGKEKSKLDLLLYLFFIIIIKIIKPYPRISVF
jgi:hypothetical protein